MPIQCQLLTQNLTEPTHVTQPLSYETDPGLTEPN